MGDLMVVGWVLLWVKFALVVKEATLRLRAPGEQLADSASGMAGSMRHAGSGVAGIPLVGEDIRRPFDDAGDAADRIAAAGTAQAEAVSHLAFWLALAVGLIPILIVLGFYLPRRIAFVREATAGQRFLDGATALDLFALRAMANQPLHRLAGITGDPAGAWRRREDEVIRELATLELRERGLPTPGT